MKLVEISTLDDPALDVYARLTEAQLRNKLEPRKGIFIAESPKVIRRALDAGMQPLSLLMDRRHLDACADILQRCGEVEVYTGSPDVLEQLTGFALTRGVLCAMRRPALPKPSELLAKASRVAVLEGIVDHTNVGAIFRSAAALECDAVLVAPTCCDPLYRRSVRVSMGTVFQVPWTRLCEDASQWPDEGLHILQQCGFKTAAFALSDKAVSLRDRALNAEPKLAMFFGTEGDGLASTTISNCDYTVKIPMAAGVDSLNVAAASAVAFWQLCAPGRDGAGEGAADA